MSAKGAPWWGYHQLDTRWAERLVKAAGVRPGDLVLDIGAGRGVITEELLAVGARVIAIEYHPDRYRQLHQRFGSEVVVVRADAADLRLPRRAFKVVANPPFGISVALLRRLLSAGSRMTTADLIVPDQVAARWARGRAPGSGRWTRTHHASLGPRLPAQAFRPAAPMPTRILRLRPHGVGGADPTAPPYRRSVPVLGASAMVPVRATLSGRHTSNRGPLATGPT
ncbi:MAG TPA: rRNA adenine N-6-methyltransferase family protein [Acidimicrobiales bacterium]|nr:rRNA adenine N-6-methyltransferase family protein [Acidimicrobiales bacterium]